MATKRKASAWAKFAGQYIKKHYKKGVKVASLMKEASKEYKKTKGSGTRRRHRS